MFGYYKEFTFVISQKYCPLFYKDHSANCCIYHTVNRRSILMTLNVFSNFEFNSDCTEALFYKIKIKIHGAYGIKKKTR